MSNQPTKPTTYAFVKVTMSALESLKRQKFNQVQDFSNPQRHQFGIDANNDLWMTNPVRAFGKSA